MFAGGREGGERERRRKKGRREWKEGEREGGSAVGALTPNLPSLG